MRRVGRRIVIVSSVIKGEMVGGWREVLASLSISGYSLRTFEIAITRSDIARSCLVRLQETFPQSQEARTLTWDSAILSMKLSRRTDYL
jgi:hypothetical protein